MKITKKILALVVALVTLMSALSLQSFALFGKKLPTVESVEFVDSYPISERDLTEYFSYLDEIAEEFGEDIASILEEFDFPYSLGYSNVPYQVEVALSDGNKFILALNENFAYFDDYTVYIDTSVDYDEFINVTENNAKSATVKFNIEVYNNKKTNEKEFVLEKAVKPCIVLDMIPLEFLPTEINYNCDYYDIDDTKFLVTYSDLKTETLTLTAKTDEYGNYDYYFGDMQLDVYADEEAETFNIRYLDAYYTKKVKINPEPFESVKITECDFDVKKGELKSIKYAIELKDGTVETFEKTFAEPVEYYDTIMIGMIENYFIYLTVSDYEYTELGMIDASDFCIRVEVGYDEYQHDTFRIENPMGFFLRIKLWFMEIIDIIKMILGIF